jgi:UDP-N-acetyl-D-glucosamine dehydrogenase
MESTLSSTSVLLEERIRERRARVCVVGLGIAGLYQACELASAGFRVSGYDIDPDRVVAVNHGRSHLPDLGDPEVGRLVAEGLLVASADKEVLGTAEVVLVSVPTLVGPGATPAVGAVVEAARTIAATIEEPALVVMKSTAYPGMTDELVGGALRAAGRRVGDDCFLACAPERGDPGNRTLRSVAETPRVVAGATPVCRALAATLYEVLGSPVRLASSLAAAELAKLHENVFRFVNIAYSLELAEVCRALEVDAYEVVELASSKPFGFMPFFPGAGAGGMYLPVNVQFLRWAAKRAGASAVLLDAAVAANDAVPAQVVRQVEASLGRSVTGSKLALLGLTYKRGTSDVRGSPSVRIYEALVDIGAEVVVFDPHAVVADGLDIRMEAWNPARLSSFDAAILATDHPEFEPALLDVWAREVVDLRGITRVSRAQNGGPP